MLALLDAPDQLLGTVTPGSGPIGTTTAETGSLRLAARMPPREDPTAPRLVYGAAATAFGTRVLFGDVAAAGARGLAVAARLLDAFRAGADHEPDLARVVYHMDLSLRGERSGAEELARVVLLEHRPDGLVAVVNRGGPAPVHVSGGLARAVDEPLGQPPIGVLNPESLRVPALPVPTSPGDRFLLRTGASDAAWPERGGAVAGALEGDFARALDGVGRADADVASGPTGPRAGASTSGVCLVEVGDPADATVPTGEAEAYRRARLPRNPLRRA
ncbi:SpoIIE family protein phosphatase [Streptodolium elevatio]|uniref:SpoIIE family protein phosphatase n=1 Tax=Streptodolium elevatio TaxID=3157996 RepID=A0ABV3DR19_9ACTN